MFNNKYNKYWPILLAVVFISGLWLGASLQSKNTGSTESKIFRLPFKHFSKISEVIAYIEDHYVDSVEKEAIVDDAIQHLMQKLDPHSYYISARELQAMNEPLEGNFEGIGVQFSIQNDTVVVISPVSGGPSEALGILSGDRIVSVDGENIAGTGITNSDVMRLLKGSGGTKVKVEIFRPGNKKNIVFDITRGKIPIYSIDVAYMINSNTGIIKLSRFSKTTSSEFRDASKKLLNLGMENLILDLRGNGGGFLDAAIDLADEFLLKDDLIVYTEGRARKREYHYASEKGSLQHVSLAILIDEGSASASEIVAGAVQDNDRGSIIGRRSFGKGLVQEQSTWPDGSATRLTIARYYTPSGRCIQKPYDMDNEKYHDDLNERYNHGELSIVDSIKIADSLAFKTKNGRTVYGGGGIMPDFFVPFDTSGSSWYLTNLYYKGLFYQFGFDYADQHRNELNGFNNFQNFIDNFSIDPVLNEFVAYAAKEGVKADNNGFETSKSIIQNRLKADIGRNIFGNEGFFPVIYQSDSTVSKALQVLNNEEI